jgi:hypothetical protein
VRLAAATSVAAAGLLVHPATLPALSTGGPSAQYPQSRLSISMPTRARAGSIVTVTMSGTNAPFTEGAPIAYSLDVFVQKQSVLPSCPASYSEELNNLANLAGIAIVRIAINLNEGVSGPFRIPVKYQTGTIRRIVICAYSRLITDDAAYAQLRHTLLPRRRH